jgi:hypothetical protein
MSQTQRIRIKEIPSKNLTFDFIEKTYLCAQEIKKILCDTHNYVDIDKILIAGYKVNNTNYVRYAFVDVYWRDNVKAKELQVALSNENGQAIIVVNDQFTWYISMQNQDDNLYDGTEYSMTTIYIKNLEDLYSDTPRNNLRTIGSFYGRMFLNQDDKELPGPIPAYRSMRNEYILDKGNVDLDEFL